MIRTFRCDETRAVFEGKRSRRFARIAAVAERKLNFVHVAHALADLAAIPGNRLEVLLGDREGQHSIRINDQYRVCFRWSDGEAYDVEIVDYH